MRGKVLAGILSALLLTGWISLEAEKKKPVPEAPSIALHEAEILIYLLPVSKQLRGKGLEVGWELLDRAGLNQEDYYNFSVFPAAAEGTTSPTLGDYAVNKHTADVWDRKTEEIIFTQETEGVQRILRKAYAIDEEVIRKYRLRRLDTPWVSGSHGGGRPVVGLGGGRDPGAGRELAAFL